MTRYDVAILSDLRYPGGTSAGVVAEVRAQAAAGLATVLVHVPSPHLRHARPFQSRIVACLRDGLAGLAHDDGKLHLWHDDLADEFTRLANAPPPGPIRLFGRREMRSMNSWLHNVDRLVRGQKPTLLVHPQDALARGITSGMMVEVKNEYGAMIVEAEVSDEVQTGNVNYPHGWGHKGGWERAVAAGGGNVNLLSPTDVAAVERLSGSSLIDGIDVELAVATSH